jgi:hypothetical protein
MKWLLATYPSKYCVSEAVVSESFISSLVCNTNMYSNLSTEVTVQMLQ